MPRAAALDFERQTRTGIAGEEQTASLYAALLDAVDGGIRAKIVCPFEIERIDIS